MRNNKLVYIIIILGLFVIFLLFQCFKPHKYVVIKVNSPTSAVVDKNNNGLADDGEEIELLNGYKVLTKQNFHNKYWKDLKLDEYSKLALMYLSEKFAADLLTDKKVQFTDSDKELIVSGDKYTNIMVKSGYLFKDGQPVNKKAYSKRMAQISKNEYKLYNAKSGKYHLLSCKYGQKAHKYVLIAKYQIPKGASPCQYCLGDKNKIKHKKKIKSENKRVHPSFTNLIFTDGSIKVILNDYTTHLRPDRHCTTNMAKEILNQINKAQKSIDIAIYGYDRVPPIENAIKRAKARGVKVRLVYDTDSKGNNIYRNTQEFASFIGNSVCDKANSACNSPGIFTNSKMHDKFYIFDNSVVITGSANLSHTDMSDYNSNCLLIINSNKVAEVYTKEFDQMYNSNFHNLKQQISDKENIKIGNSLLSVYFSPKDTIIKRIIIPYINRANKYIYMPVFLITDNSLATALINAKKRGIDVRVIIDATNAKNTPSKHRLLRKAGVLVKTENYAGKLHSKSILIDDKYAIIGSMNFSKSGELKNDENVIVLQNSGVTKFYKLFFNFLWNKIPNYWLNHDVSAESHYSIGSCSDGIDNDYDGLTDAEDEGCKFKPKVKH